MTKEFGDLLDSYMQRLRLGSYKISEQTTRLFGEAYRVPRNNIEGWRGKLKLNMPSDWRPVLAMAAVFRVSAAEAEEMLRAINISQTLHELAQDPQTTFADRRLLNWWLAPSNPIGVTPPIPIKTNRIDAPSVSNSRYLTIILDNLRIAYLGQEWKNHDLNTLKRQVCWEERAGLPSITENLCYGLVSAGNTDDMVREQPFIFLAPENLVRSLTVYLALGAQAEHQVLTFQLDLSCLWLERNKYREELFAILGTRDRLHPLPDVTEWRKLLWKNYRLFLDNWPVDNLSYAVFRLLRTETRGRYQAGSASPWNRLFTQAEQIARRWHEGERDFWESAQNAWEECHELLLEAGKLLRADPFYLPEEAENIYYDVLKTCKAKIIPAESSKGGMRDYHEFLEDDPAFGQLLEAHKLDPTLDWTERMSRYEGALQRTRHLLGRFGGDDVGAMRGG